MEYAREGLLELTKALVRIRSVSHTAGENEAAAFIYESLAVEPYFQKHPDFLRYLPVEEGGLERRAVMALVRAGSHTRRTVLLNGHFDVVDTDVCGDLAEAAFDAAKVRLRPIMMTVLTLVFGMLPLLYASGASANGNRTLGAGAVGGMIIGTVALLFFVPPMFIAMQRLQEKFGFIIVRKKKQ